MSVYVCVYTHRYGWISPGSLVHLNFWQVPSEVFSQERFSHSYVALAPAAEISLRKTYSFLLILLYIQTVLWVASFLCWFSPNLAKNPACQSWKELGDDLEYQWPPWQCTPRSSSGENQLIIFIHSYTVTIYNNDSLNYVYGYVSSLVS